MRVKSVGRTRQTAGMLAVIALIVSTMSCLKSNVVGATGTGFVWVATQGNQQVNAFTIDLSTGALTAVGTNQSTGVQPSAMTISSTSSGRFLFVANTSDNTISSYTVKSDGSLIAGKNSASTLAQGTTVSLGLNPVALAVDPTGTLLFVADEGQPNNANAPGGISVFQISGTSLTPTGPACPAGFSQSTCPFVIADIVTGFGSGPDAVLASPAGKFLYVANSFTNTVQAFSYDGSGNLQSLNTFATGNNPSALAFSRCAGITTATVDCVTVDANTLFVANAGSNTLSTFAACIQISTTCSTPNGFLVETSGSPVAADIAPVALIVDPLGNFVYAVNSKSNTISQFRYSPSNGVLTALTPASLATGVSPFSGAATTDGTYVLVSNNNGSSLSVFAINSNGSSNGRLSLASTSSITIAGQPSAILIR